MTYRPWPLLLALALTACTGHGTVLTAPHAARAAVQGKLVEPPEIHATGAVAALPPTATRRLVETPGGGSLDGTVAFDQVTDPFFADSAALKLLALPAAHALITLTTLDDEVYTKGGAPITATADATGAFSLKGVVPTDRPVVLTALVAGDHRLSAIVPVGATTVTLNEATSAAVELARWQVPAAASAGKKALGELGAALLVDLATRGAKLLTPADFPAKGAVPAVAPLKAGNGLTLRNAYVKAFGSRVTAAGNTDADALSDAWKGILDYRPLALTRVAGLDPATLHADDAVMDADGNVVVAPHNTFLIYMPAKDRGPLPGSTAALTGGKLYALAGQVNGGDGPGTLDAYNQLYGPIEQASVADPAAAPLATDGAPIWLPFRLMLEDAPGATMPHVFFTSRQGHRLYVIPGADFTRYGRSFQAGRLYTLAGFGTAESRGPLAIPDDPNTPDLDETTYAYALGDDGPAYQAPLAFPQGVAEDSRHNLYVCDAGGYGAALATTDPDATVVTPLNDPNFPGRLTNVYHQSVRLIRASDGKIFTFHLTNGGAPFPLAGALDLRVAESASGNWVYVSDSLQHCVVRFALPANLADLDAAAPASRPVEVVLGSIGAAGVRTPTAPVPAVEAVNDGVPKAQVLLNTPTGIELDAAGNLVVADAGHLRLLDQAAGKVYLIGGSLPGGFDQGDSRLVTPSPRYITRQRGHGNLVVVDDATGAVQMLWGERGLR